MPLEYFPKNANHETSRLPDRIGVLSRVSSEETICAAWTRCKEHLILLLSFFSQMRNSPLMEKDSQ